MSQRAIGDWMLSPGTFDELHPNIHTLRCTALGAVVLAIGVFGSLVSTPILNPPQSAILGMHKIQERPIAENGEVVIRPMMYLALSYDHRIVDGKEAVQFLVHIKASLEDPSRMLFDL